IAIDWTSMVADYLVAYAVLGLGAGLMKGRRSPMIGGTLLGGLFRFLAHYVVGAVVWGKYMPETFFGMTMTTPWFYSLLYNAPYMIGSIAIVLVLAVLLEKPMGKYFRGEDLLR
ncbi:MAG: energy-coupled thiamine transporter ThiT, partial [Oscillospiraceae bacterium]|nr:energy-coupled thiamine transporter ThiT [Oscillospiraceae bacterium]